MAPGQRAYGLDPYFFAAGDTISFGGELFSGIVDEVAAR